MTISEYLSRLKEEKSLTQQQIAELSGVPMGTVSRILAGQVECPSFQAVADMTKALGGSLDELAGIERKEPEKTQDGLIRCQIRTRRDLRGQACRDLPKVA